MGTRSFMHTGRLGMGLVARLVVGVMVLQAVAVGCGTESTPVPTATAVPVPTATATVAAVGRDYWPTNGWRVSTPEEQGIDSAGLLAAMMQVEEQGINLRSMTVIRNGYVVLDAFRQPFAPDQKVQVYSVTKSVIGALTGIALEEGYIKSLDEPVLGYFPRVAVANLDERKEAITIRDLISMQPGLNCADDIIGFGMEQSADWVQYVLDLPMDATPGTKMIYCTAGVHLMSAILTKATGMSTAEYARTRLFEPLGIKEDDIVWPADPQGITLGGYGIEIRPLDMAKLGLLYLNDGRWDGKQVVPEEWVKELRSVQAIGENDKNYGYLWWVYPNYYAAEGYGEQKIMVVGERNMVVVMTAAIDWHKWQPLEGILKDYLIPAAKSEGMLADNPKVNEELRARVEDWANPGRPVAALSETAKGVTGKTYVIEDSPVGWREITMSFVEGSVTATAKLLTDEGVQEVIVGLDNVYRVNGPMDGNWTALKGEWVNENTFAGRELQASPSVNEEEFRFEFVGDQVRIHVEETVFGSYSVDMVGAMKE